jgi:hypothetical protein
VATRGTPAGAHTFGDEKAVAEALASHRRDPIRVWRLQEIHGKTAATPAVL